MSDESNSLSHPPEELFLPFISDSEQPLKDTFDPNDTEKATGLTPAWTSDAFPALPIKNYDPHNINEALQKAFGLVVVNIDTTDVNRKPKLKEYEGTTAHSFSMKYGGRSIYFQPFLFEDDSGKKYLFINSKGVGVTRSINWKLPHQSRAYNASLVENPTGKVVLGGSELEEALKTIELTEYLIQKGLETPRPLALFKRSDHYVQSIAESSTSDFAEFGIFLRAFSGLFRMDNFSDWLNYKDKHTLVSLGLNLERRFLELRGYKFKNLQEYFEHVLGTYFRNLKVLGENGVCFMNMSPQNVCFNGEITDFDDLAYYGADPTLKAMFSASKYLSEDKMWQTHYEQAIYNLKPYTGLLEPKLFLKN